MKKISLIFTFLMCLLINNTLAITENDANQFVVDIGNQAIKILKIPVDDKEKRKKELQNLLQEKFDMPFIARIILGKEVFKILPKKNLRNFLIYLKFILSKFILLNSEHIKDKNLL